MDCNVELGDPAKPTIDTKPTTKHSHTIARSGRGEMIGAWLIRVENMQNRIFYQVSRTIPSSFFQPDEGFANGK
jgi:hypothetical protein